MLEYYKEDVPDFIGDVINNYIQNAIKYQDAYSTQKSAHLTSNMSISNRRLLPFNMPMTFA
jgi:hypothetical protein